MGRQPGRRPGDQHRARVEVEHHVVPRHRAGRRRRADAQAGADAGHQLLDPERLGQIVDRPQREGPQPRLEVGARRQHDRRRRQPPAPLLEHREAALPRQHQVEHREVEAPRQPGRRPALPVARQLDHKAGRLQPAHQPGGDRRIVLDDEDAGGRRVVGHGPTLSEPARRLWRVCGAPPIRLTRARAPASPPAADRDRRARAAPRPPAPRPGPPAAAPRR